MVDNYDKIILFSMAMIESVIIFVLVVTCNHYRSYIVWKQGFLDYQKKYDEEFDRATKNFELYVKTHKELTKAYIKLSKYETTTRDNGTSQV